MENEHEEARLRIGCFGHRRGGCANSRSAQGFGVYVGGDRGYYGDRYYGGPSVRFYDHDRGLHRGWYHRNHTYYGDRSVVIRRHSWD